MEKFMSNFKKILTFAATSALALTVGAFALVGCSGDGTPKDNVFEAEEAVLFDPEDMDENNYMKLQPNAEGSEETYTLVSYFATEGQTITWNVKSSKECDVTLKLYASSCVFCLTDANGNVADLTAALWMQQFPEGFDQTTMQPTLAAVKGADIALTVNDAEVTLEGSLPELKTGVVSNAWEAMGIYSAVKIGAVSATVHLTKGENKIVLTPSTGVGYNVDKITINTDAKLTFKKTDNSARLPAPEEEEEQ